MIFDAERHPKSGDWRVLRAAGGVHHDAADPHRGQLVRLVLQEPPLEERGLHEEEGADQGAGR